MTSQGPHVNGLDARKWISAGYACHLSGNKERPVIKAVYEKTDDITAPIINIKNNIIAGYKYLQFGNLSPKTVTIQVNALEDIKIIVRIDAFDGKEIGCFDIKKGETESTVNLNSAVIGKHAVYFEFKSSSDNYIAEFLRFTFS